jgi:phosphotriesterase-related protein
VNAHGVWGPIPGTELGITLVHEHVLFDVSDYWQRPSEATRMRLAEAPVTIETLGDVRFDPFLLRDNLTHGDVDLAVEELGAFAARGGATVVDATNVSMGRDPRALRAIARRTGLGIVMGSGYYTEISLDDAFRCRTVDDIADELVRDVTIGVGDSGIRAGLIGEIGTSSPITPSELVSVRAAARAQALTGAPLMVHLDGWAREGHAVLDVIEGEGADPRRVILCHMNPSCDDPSYQTSLAERGAFIEYDMMGMTYVYPVGRACPDDERAMRGVRRLMEAGYGHRVLISQDVFLKSMLRRYGGLGYTHVLDSLLPIAEAVGVGGAEVMQILTSNAQAAIATFPSHDVAGRVPDKDDVTHDTE